MKELTMDQMLESKGGMSDACAGAIGSGMAAMATGLAGGPAGLAFGTLVFGLSVMASC